MNEHSLEVKYSKSVVRNVLKLHVYVTIVTSHDVLQRLVIKCKQRLCKKFIKNSNDPIKSVILGKSDMKLNK